MQGAQSQASGGRGVGRYTLEMTRAIVDRFPQFGWEIYLALNGVFLDTAEILKGEFAERLGENHIFVWQQFFDTSRKDRRNKARAEAGELLREAFLASLSPDVIFSTNLQEGFHDAAVTSVKRFPANVLYCSVLHDLTPMIFQDNYLGDKVLKEWYKEKIEAVKASDLVVTVSEYSKQQIQERLDIPAERICVTYNAIDEKIFFPREGREEQRREFLQQYGIFKPYLMYTGGADFHKNLTRLFKAVGRIAPDLRKNIQLVLVGGDLKRLEDGIRQMAAGSLSDEEMVFTGFVPDEHLAELYRAAELFVFPSFSEGFGIPPLEAVSCGTPALAGKLSSLPEVLGTPEATFDPYDVEDMAGKIEAVLKDQSLRNRIYQQEARHAKGFSWSLAAENLRHALEQAVRDRRPIPVDGTGDIPGKLIDSIRAMKNRKALKEDDLKNIASSIAETFPPAGKRKPVIYLDVSSVVISDDRSGIQRVVRAICNEMLQFDMQYDAKAVFTDPAKMSFHTAVRLYEQIYPGWSAGPEDDDEIEFLPGDVLLYLDLHPAVAITHVPLTRYLRLKGVRVYHVVYDLLPVTLPDYFEAPVAEEFKHWLKATLHASGVICISRSVALEFRQFLNQYELTVPAGYRIQWFHLGADLKNSLPSQGMPDDAEQLFALMSKAVPFLMVGTIEPRKGYQQMLRVFSHLWQERNFPGILVMVGRQGWKMDDFAEEVRLHPEYSKRLFWLTGISDEYLEKLYEKSACLIAASEGEGFGLPLIEAARHGIPLLVRDIPVFREVAAGHASYFQGNSDAEVAASIEAWLKLKEKDSLPDSASMPYLSWKESAQQLAEVIWEGTVHAV